MEKLITKSFRRLLDKGIHRGFITYEELGKSLGKRHYNQNNIETAFLHIFDNKVCLVKKKSDFRLIKKRDSNSPDLEKSKDIDKSDDPIRMYLREMGGVELLSREGEIAIAKRIEAGKDFMINGLFRSPLAAKKVFEWKEKLEKNELLVREIIDIDSSYVESESENEHSTSHYQIGKKLNLMDFDVATKTSGARFVFLKGKLALLERAISNFMLDCHTKEFGYQEISPPLIVNDSTMFGTGQLPKFESDQFEIKLEDEKSRKFLIPTAEVILTNIVRESFLKKEELPLRLVASTACFRKEAGSYGKDTRGMIRQHQFYKVELVSIVEPMKMS